MGQRYLEKNNYCPRWLHTLVPKETVQVSSTRRALSQSPGAESFCFFLVIYYSFVFFLCFFSLSIFGV
jgi:hypothetical protein